MPVCNGGGRGFRRCGLGQLQPQLAPRPGQQGFQRIDAETEACRGLALVQTAVMTKDHGFALPLGQVRQSRLQGLFALGVAKYPLRPVLLIDQRIRVDLADWPSATQAITAAVQHDLVQPGGKAGPPGLPPRCLAPGLQEDVLTDILSFTAIVQQPGRRGMQSTEMTIDQLLEGTLVARGKCQQQIGIGVVVGRRWQVVVQARDSVGGQLLRDGSLPGRSDRPGSRDYSLRDSILPRP